MICNAITIKMSKHISERVLHAKFQRLKNYINFLKRLFEWYTKLCTRKNAQKNYFLRDTKQKIIKEEIRKQTKVQQNRQWLQNQTTKLNKHFTKFQGEHSPWDTDRCVITRAENCGADLQVTLGARHRILGVA